MNSVGIDISKGRSTVAVMRPFGEVVISPFAVRHPDSELSELARRLKRLDGPRCGAVCLRRQCKAGAWLREQRFEACQDRQEGRRKAGELWP